MTNSATGVNIIEKRSSLKFSDSLIVWIVTQCQFEIIDSWSVRINIIIDKVLVIRA